MKIYTKTGDNGSTQVGCNMARVMKDDPRLEVIGTLDELNSHIGLVQAITAGNYDISDDTTFKDIQDMLFEFGMLEGSKVTDVHIYNKISEMEELIDDIDKDLPPLKNFILPGGTLLAAQFHVARTICRRLERLMVANKFHYGEAKLAYINRLSDLFFVAARAVNSNYNKKDIIWEAIK
jgi:cob(I)alamin adenosyltransferase